MTEPSCYNVDPGESDASINSSKISKIKSKTYEFEFDNSKKSHALRSQKVPSSTIPKVFNLKTYDPKRFQPIYVYKDLELYYHKGELNLSGKHLSHLDISSLAYSFGHRLKKLDLSGCGLTNTDLDDLEGCHGLEELNLSNNRLFHFSFSPYRLYISSLKMLDLSGCGVTDTDLHGFENLSGLEELKLSNNPLYHCRFFGYWEHMSRLKKLDLSGCGLTDIDLDGLKNFHGLKELNLSNNPLYHFRFLLYWKHMPSLKKLDLSGCVLTDTDLDGLKNFHRLKELNLSVCCLTKWPSGLKKCSSLEQLNLSDNFFGHQDLLEKLNNGKMLSQSGLHKSGKELLEPAPSALGLPNLSRIIFEDAVYTKNNGGYRNLLRANS